MSFFEYRKPARAEHTTKDGLKTLRETLSRLNAECEETAANRRSEANSDRENFRNGTQVGLEPSAFSPQPSALSLQSSVLSCHC